MRMKGILTVVAALTGAAACAANISVADGGSIEIDLQGAANTASDKIVFQGAGTLRLTNPPASGECIFRPAIVAEASDKTVTVSSDACAGKTLRFPSCLIVKGTFAATGFGDVRYGALGTTVDVINEQKTVITPFQPFDVAAIAEGTTVTIDGLAQVPKLPTSGCHVEPSAIVALTGKNALGALDEYEIGFNAVLVATDAFKSGSTIRMAAGCSLGWYASTVNADYSWTQVGTDTTGIAFDLVLGGANAGKVKSRFLLWSGTEKAQVSQRLSGKISGTGDVLIKPCVKGSGKLVWRFDGRHEFVGQLTCWKAQEVDVYLGVPESGVLPYSIELNNMCGLRFDGGSAFGGSSVTIPDIQTGYYNTTLYVGANQTVTLNDLHSSVGINVSGSSEATSKLIIKKNSMAVDRVLRTNKVALELDQATIDAHPFYWVDNGGTRRWYADCSKASSVSSAYGWSGEDRGVVVCAGRTAELSGFADTAREWTVTAEAGAKATVSGIAAGATVKVTEGSTVRLGASTSGAVVKVPAGAVVEPIEKGAEAVSIVCDGGTVRYDDACWTNSVALWLDASKADSVKPLVNGTTVKKQTDRADVFGEASSFDAVAWWYDWRASQTTYYLYNNRAYQNGGYENTYYVYPWREPSGGPGDGPYMHFSRLSGKTAKSGTPVRLDVHRFDAEKLSTCDSIDAKYVVFVYGASTHEKMCGGAALMSSQSNGDKNPYDRGVHEDNRDFNAPIVAAGDFTVRVDGAVATLAREMKFKEGWQIIGFDTKSNAFGGIGRGLYNYGGGQKYAEILVFDAMPTERQKVEIERYLAAKWRLDAQYVGGKNPAWSTANVSGTGKIEAGAGVDLTTDGSFRGEIRMTDGQLVMSDSLKPVPTWRDVPAEDQLAWFDPSVRETVRTADLAEDHPQYGQISWVYDRVAARRVTGKPVLGINDSTGEIAVGTGNRRPYLKPMTNGGIEMNWMDYNNYAEENNSSASGGWYGNAFRFYAVGNDTSKIRETEQILNIRTIVMVQNSVRGGGTPISTAYIPPKGISRKTSNPKDALWGTGAPESLTDASVWVNDKKVANPFKSAEFTGAAEVLAINTTEGVDFPLKAIGNFYNSEGAMENGEIVGEILCYSAKLSDTDRQDVQAYLAAKWFGGVMPGYVRPETMTVKGAGALTVAKTAYLPTCAADYVGAVTVGSGALAFEIDATVAADRASFGFVDVGAGTFGLGEAGSVTVVNVGASPLATGLYKLISWGALADGTTFAFANGKTTATIGRRACELQVMPDGLYLNVMKRGLALLVK